MELQVSAFLASLEASPAYSRSTRLAYASDLRVFLEFLLNKLHRAPLPTDLNVAMITGFLESEKQAGRRKSTLSRRLSTLRKFNLFLSQQSLIPVITFIPDARLVNRPGQSPTSQEKPAYLTQAQIESMLTLIGTSPHPRALRDQALLILIAETGLSVGSVVALNLTDLDLRARRFMYSR